MIFDENHPIMHRLLALITKMPMGAVDALKDMRGTPPRKRKGKIKHPKLRDCGPCHTVPNRVLTKLMQGGPNQGVLEMRCHSWLAEQREANV